MTRPQVVDGDCRRNRGADARRGAVIALAFLAVCYPLVSTRVPLLWDYVQHMARIYIIANHDELPALARIYEVHWALVPYLAMDVLLPPLLKFLDWEDAGRLFILAALVLLFSGMVALRRVVLGRVGWLPLAALPFLYNFPLSSGLLSYVFSVGLALLVFAGWIALSERGAARLALGLVGSTAIALCHVFGFGAYALMVVAYELGRPHALRQANLGRWVPCLAQLLPSAVILFLSPSPAVPDHVTIVGGVIDRVMGLSSLLVFGATPLDMAAFVLCALLAAVTVMARVGRLHPALRAPLVVLVLVALALPIKLDGVWGLHVRLPIVAAMVFFAGFEVNREKIRWAGVLLAVLVVLAGVKAIETGREMEACAKDTREFRASLPVVPLGSRVLVAADLPTAQAWPCLPLRYPGMGVLAVIDRQAYVPQFVTATRIVSFTPPYASLWPPSPPEARQAQLVAARQGGPASSPTKGDLGGWENTVDYVVWFRFARTGTLLPERLELLKRGSFFDIYRVRR